MVDALHEAHRVLREGGLLVDARPDSRRIASIDHVSGRARRRVATVATQRSTMADDRTSDRAVARVKREGLFRSRREGGFLHRLRFAGLAELRAYLDDHLRLVHRARWSADRRTRERWRDDAFEIERRVRYELLEKTTPR